jgi:DNA-binding NarL/FixJ family response regulator
MSKELHFLFVDDHPTIIEGYKSMLYERYTTEQVQVHAAFSSEMAYEKLFSSNRVFDIVILDIGLPPFHEKRIQSGEDLAFLIQKQFPATKILISTSHLEAFILYNIVKKVNPDGAKLSSVITVVTENYGQYHQCKVKVDTWIEWYNAQKNIHTNIK